MTVPDPRRWDTDDRLRGVGDARAFVPGIQELVSLAERDDWIAEGPLDHLMPGIRRGAERAGMRLAWYAADSVGVLAVCVESGQQSTTRELREAAWTVLGSIAEAASHVREVGENNGLTFDVVTGTPPGAGPFATHGHTLRLYVR
jgi:hypothetical protein